MTPRSFTPDRPLPQKLIREIRGQIRLLLQRLAFAVEQYPRGKQNLCAENMPASLRWYYPDQL
ncbi:hypothetical protein MPLSOD_40433 [Mesorhizobium sp. SOD10]|nr:hypothetical protein MPLSOD_40433 [Mesorhizobium sp. SOD10]